MERSDYQIVECGRKRKGAFQRNFIMNLSEVENFRRSNNNTGIFISAYRFANKEREGEIYAPHVYLDFDDPALNSPDSAAEVWKRLRRDFLYACGILDTYYGIKRDLLMVYFSGCKGLSVLISSAAFGLEPAEDVNRTVGLIAKDIASCIPHYNIASLDLKIYDRSRLWRLANSRHEKTGLYKVRLQFQEIMSMDIGEIRQIASSPREDRPVPAFLVERARARVRELLERSREINRGQEKGFLRYEPPCIKNILTRPVAQGRRNNIATFLASYYMQRGLDIAETTARLLGWNKEMCTPSLPEREVVQCVQSVYKHGYKYGCNTVKWVGACESGVCKFARSGLQSRPQLRRRFAVRPAR